MDTKALRQKVLDLAIRGKLVPQDPNDEPASVLLERIRQQKQQMVKEGKLKAKDIKNDSIIFVGEDNLHYEKFANGSVKCIEDEIPFDLPDGWAWSKIGPLCEYITSGSRGWAQYYSETGCLFLRMGNLSRDSFDLRLDNLQRVNLPDNAEGTRTRVAENDLLFSITAEIGMLGLIPADFEEAYINQHVGLIRFLKEAQTKYFPYILMSEFCRDQYYTVQSGMKNSFRLDNIQNILAPVPPLGEQIRIAEKLSSIWSHVQKIDIESKTANDIISKAKSKILDFAIRGQLVPQDPTDEPASVLMERIRAEKEELIKQGKIKRDKKESVIFRGEDNSYYEKMGDRLENIDIPFDLPDGWTWAYLSDIVSILNGDRGQNYPAKSKLKSEGVPFVSASNIEDGVVSSEGLLCLSESQYNALGAGKLAAGDIVYCIRGSLGKCGLFTMEKGAIASSLVIVRSILGEACITDYVFIYLNSTFANEEIQKYDNGSAQPNLAAKDFMRFLVPVPPIKEQECICDKAKALFALVENVEKSLS